MVLKILPLWESYNAAIHVNSESKEVDFYKKSKLVPGAEITPFKRIVYYIKPLKKMVNQLGGSLDGLGMQEDRSVFKNKDGDAIAPVICYESIYGEYCTGYVRNKANAMFIVTNDGWWDNTAGHRQHLMFASLRAIESRRSIARSANSGVSAFINQRGDILQATHYDEEDAIRGKYTIE